MQLLNTSGNHNATTYNLFLENSGKTGKTVESAKEYLLSQTIINTPLTEDQDITLAAHLEYILEQMAAPKPSASASASATASFNDMLSGNAGNVTADHIDQARATIKDKLNLTAGSAMETVVESLVSDISETINRGVPFQEMVDSISESFGSTIKAQLASGELKMEDMQASAEKLMSALDPSAFMNMNDTTPASPEAPEDKLARRLNRNRSERRQEELAVKKLAKKALKKKSRK
jgi:hypothetical protein